MLASTQSMNDMHSTSHLHGLSGLWGRPIQASNSRSEAQQEEPPLGCSWIQRLLTPDSTLTSNGSVDLSFGECAALRRCLSRPCLSRHCSVWLNWGWRKGGGGLKGLQSIRGETGLKTEFAGALPGGWEGFQKGCGRSQRAEQLRGLHNNMWVASQGVAGGCRRQAEEWMKGAAELCHPAGKGMGGVCQGLQD